MTPRQRTQARRLFLRRQHQVAMCRHCRSWAVGFMQTDREKRRAPRSGRWSRRSDRAIAEAFDALGWTTKRAQPGQQTGGMA